MYQAFRHVKHNQGAAGVDRQSLSAFEANLEVELSRLLLELKEKRYQAQPVKRVVIAKDDGGERLLGIPTVRGLAAIIRELNPVPRGFASYFRVANCARVLKQVMGWVRRRLRCIQLKQWKKPGRLHRWLKQQGYRPPFQFIKMQRWRNAASPLAHLAIPNAYLHDELRLMDLAKVKTGITVPGFGVS